MINQAIQLASQHRELPCEMIQRSMGEILECRATEVQTAAYLTALAVKGETVNELVASVREMRKHYELLFPKKDVLEIIGTGGDYSNSFNVSTTSAIVAAAAGVPIVKHGNRAATSKSGSADILEELGVNIFSSPSFASELVEKCNLCFIYNKNYPSVMSSISNIRQQLSIVTVFNKIRWLNPTGANMELLGVYSPELVEPMALALCHLGVKRALIVCGHDGLDEISVCANTSACEVRDGTIHLYEINPEDFGIPIYEYSQIEGGSPKENAAITRAILSGCEKGAKRDIVLLNAAAAIYIACPQFSFKDALKVANKTIDSGMALSQLERFISLSNIL